jgi:hypothetical protein
MSTTRGSASRVWLAIASLLFLAQISACASATPPRRLVDYLGPSADGTHEPLPPRPIHAGLVLIPDRSRPDAMVLPEEAFRRLADTLQQQLSEMTLVVIDRVIPSEGIRPGGDLAQLRELGTRHGVEYLVVVIASAVEQEYPKTVFLGWVTHAQPGWRRDNWSLLETALVDVQTGHTFVRAEGVGFATLDRPAAPGINQWYPVIQLRPLDRRYYPPTYEGAPNTLRVIAMQEAAKRLVLKFQDAWIEKRQQELDAAG